MCAHLLSAEVRPSGPTAASRYQPDMPPCLRVDPAPETHIARPLPPGDDEHGWSEELSFRTLGTAGAYPLRIGVIGDLGGQGCGAGTHTSTAAGARARLWDGAAKPEPGSGIVRRARLSSGKPSMARPVHPSTSHVRSSGCLQGRRQTQHRRSRALMQRSQVGGLADRLISSALHPTTCKVVIQ